EPEPQLAGAAHRELVAPVAFGPIPAAPAQRLVVAGAPGLPEVVADQLADLPLGPGPQRLAGEIGLGEVFAEEAGLAARFVGAELRRLGGRRRGLAVAAVGVFHGDAQRLVAVAQRLQDRSAAVGADLRGAAALDAPGRGVGPDHR